MNRLILAAVLSLVPFATVRADEPTTKELAARIEQLEKRQFDSEKKVDALAEKLKGVDSKLDAILSAVTSKPAPAVAVQPAASSQTARFTPAGTRAPIGHTHTCANGHTWDHNANPSHVCRFCGLAQNIQDPIPRPVTLAAGDVFAAAPQAAPAPYYGQASQSSYSFQSSYSASSGGCANGQCTSGGYQFAPVRGFFARLRGR